MRAGFAEIDITPPIGISKIGWLVDIVAEKVLDPLFARVAVFENATERVGFIQLDTLSIRWTQVRDIRRRVQEQYGFPGACVLVAATHNHAGPAVANCGDVRRNEDYIETLVAKVVSCFGAALASLQEAEIGLNWVSEFAVAKNRRVIMRDGTVKTHAKFSEPDALCFEGPVDPEVAVLAARAPAGGLLGCLVNYACHPTHHGGERALSGGYPGVLAGEMRKRGCPVTLFLTGASGNVSAADPVNAAYMPMHEVGERLADDTQRALAGMTFTPDCALGAASTSVELPYRRTTPEETAGTVTGAQRFVDPGVYDRTMPALLERIRARKTQPAEVQVLFAGDAAFAGIPAEYFVEHGLRIKLESFPRHALVVSHANGMVGYVPTRDAFERGGYETTLTGSSRLAPEAGDILADAAIRLIRTGP